MRHIVLVLGLALTVAGSAALTAPIDCSELPAAGTFTESVVTPPAGALGPLTALSGTPGKVELGARRRPLRQRCGHPRDGARRRHDHAPLRRASRRLCGNGGIVGEFFDHLDGTLAISVGADRESFAVMALSAAFAGVLSDTSFTEAVISILDFDTDASSVGFIGLETTTSVASLLAAAPLLATALAAIGLLGRRRG